ncbi:uncharacterized protein LOC131282261 [Anopheles ziemanni]|uniref:uncharacterized protein LOC131282261 n=1 Tax=Anopheles ziemanni TaxID=345580 RepID=UPI00265DF24E|nr:uncharacterized protein LOC131282261 [Anopheles ziemanni]
MKPSLRYTYCTLLLVFLVSSCTLFIIVASETLKPTADDHSQHLHHHNHHKHQEQHHGAPSMPHPARIPDGSLTVGAKQRAGSDLLRDGSAEYEGNTNHNSLADGVLREKGQSRQQVESHSGEPPNSRANVRPLKRPSPGGKITSKKDILTEKPSPQPEEPPDLKDVIFLDTISKNVGVTNSGLQDIPGPPSVITLVDNQHRELNNIESKLEENLEATLKNLSHNNVLNVPPGGISLQADDEQARQKQQPQQQQQQQQQPDSSTIIDATDRDEQDGSYNGTAEAEDSATFHREIQPSAIPEDSNTVELKPLEVNLTEENPMPVFSEWAQKQMAEAEKKLGEVVNASAMKKGTKPAGSKTGGPMKLRAKNYAAPECGAKIIASNPEAQSTGSVLTAPKDEYLLNPCTSKIWFVVELCEPVQAERIELANFELFSSSPKEFSVSVSNRFPTRDWANVGQFTAKDERDVQSFMLHPHLFGKFVRVEILSHYNQEHFCPVSLFRVYGTSEFEAFETDNTPLQPDDDDDDEEDENEVGIEGSLRDDDLLLTEPGTGGPVDGNGKKTGGKHPNNLLKSAGEVVMSMVKKAAEALGKTGNDSNDLSNASPTTTTSSPPTSLSSSSSPSTTMSCVTLAYTIRCVNCTDRFRARLESTMNCKHNLLTSLLGIVRIGRSFDSAQHFLCANVLGFNLPRKTDYTGAGDEGEPAVCLNMRYSVLNLLPDELVAGLCNVVAYNLKLIPANPRTSPDVKGDGGGSQGEEHQAHRELPVGERETAGRDIPPQHSNDNGRQVGQQEQQEQRGEISFEGETVDPDDSSPSQNTLPPKEDVNMFNVATEPPPSLDGAGGGDEPGQNLPSATATTGQHQDQQQQQQQEREKEDHHHQHWETIDETEGIPIGGGIGAPSGAGGSMVGTGSNNGHGTTSNTQKVQPESVFLRLSNRIKALERNMSLSGQYLEELSRRYRKQVEELQHSYAKTLHEIEEQNRKMRESETSLREVNDQLRRDLFEFQTMVVDWRNVVLAVLGVVVVLLLTLILFVRSVLASSGRRASTSVGASSQRPAPLPQSVIDRELAQVGSDARPIRGRMLRRKSIDGMPVAGGGGNVTGGGAGDGSISCVSSSSGVIIATAEPSTGGSSMSPARLRIKRPSEEALNISGTYMNLLIDDGSEGVKEPRPIGPMTVERKKSKHKHRKVSAPSMIVTVGNVATSTPSANSAVSGGPRYELPKRSTSMIEPQEQRFRLVNGTGSSDGGGHASQTPDHSNRIDELPYLEDNDEFIIPTASDLSYDEFMPGSTVSSGAIAALREEMVDGSGRLTNGSETTEDVSPLPTDSANNSVVQQTKKSSSRRLSSPAFFKTSLLRSSLGSKRRSSKKGSSNGDINAPGGSSSSNSSNTSSNSSNSSNISGSSSAGQHSTVANGAPSAGADSGDGDRKDSWYRWWSENRKQGPSPSTASSSQQDASTFSSSSLSSKHQARRERLKAKSESPPAVTGGSLIEEQPTPVKLSVSFNGDLPTNGGGSNGGGLERKTTGGSRGSIRRLFRKVF